MPSGVKAKIVSKVQNNEVVTDKRPEGSTSVVNLELSLHSQSGSPITLTSTNELRVEFVSETGLGIFNDFGSQPIIIQQYDPNTW